MICRWRAITPPILLIGVALFAFAAPAAKAQPGAADLQARCRRVGVDDTLQPIPPDLVAASRRLFGLPDLPADAAQRAVVARCMGGVALLCNTGANLPCGKANTARELPAAQAWCRERPNSPFVPMVVTGHDTIYRWRCAGSHAEAGEPAERVDERGFIARFWKRLE